MKVSDCKWPYISHLLIQNNYYFNFYFINISRLKKMLNLLELTRVHIKLSFYIYSYIIIKHKHAARFQKTYNKRTGLNKTPNLK